MPEPVNNTITCPANNGSYFTPDYVQKYNIIAEFYLRLDNDPQANINLLQGILSWFVCAYANMQANNQPPNQQFIIHANAAILRLAQCYYKLGQQQNAAGQTEAAKNSFQKARQLINAFNQSNAQVSYTREQGSYSVGFGGILKLARALPNTYQYAPTSGEVQNLLGEINNALGSSQALVVSGSHFLTHSLSYHSNQNPPFVCSCGNSNHVYYYDVSIEAITVWAEQQARTASGAAQVISKIDKLIAMVESCVNPPHNLQGDALRPSAAGIYRRIIEAIGRAYAKAGQYEKADTVFKALLGEGTLPTNLRATGVSLSTAPNNLGIMAERIWNLFDWAKATNNLELFNQALNLLDDNNIAQRAQAREAILWELVKMGQNPSNSRAERVAILNRVLNLVNSYFPQGGIKNQIVGAVIWEFIQMGGNDLLDRAIELAIQYNMTDHILNVLSKKLNLLGGHSDEALNFLMVSAAVLKSTLSQVDRSALTSDPVWSDIKASASALNINLSSLSMVNNGAVLDNRLRLAGTLQQIASILKIKGQPYQTYLDLASAEYKACEMPLVNAIQGNHPTLDNFMQLANVYKNMGDAASRTGDEALADICFKRALYIYRVILIGPAGVNLDDPIFNAYQNVLQDINNGENSVISRLLSKHQQLRNALDASERLETTVIYAELVIRIEMKPTSGNLSEIREAHQRIVALLEQVISNTATSEELRERARAAKNQADYNLAEAYIRSGDPDRAITIFTNNIANILSSLPPEDPQRSYAEISLLGNLTGLAWAYGEMANLLPDTISGRENAAKYCLISAAIYNTLLYGTEGVEIDGAAVPNVITNTLQSMLPYQEALLAHLSDINNSNSGLQLALAESLKRAAGTYDPELLISAIHELEKTPEDNELYPTALSALIEAQVALHLSLANQGQISDALNYINAAVELATNASQTTLRGIQAQIWALGVRGGFLEAAGNIGAAHQDFVRAADILQGLLNNDQLTTGLTAEQISNLKLDLADILKAASKGFNSTEEKLQALEQAAELYREVNSLAAQAGLAEVLIIQGEITNEIDKYLEALGITNSSLENAEQPETIKQAAAYLRNISTLMWALNKLANKLDTEESHPYGDAALALYRRLLNIEGNHIPSIAGLALNEILAFIDNNRDLLTHPLILDEAHLNLAGLKLGYLGTLRANRSFQLALNEAKRFLSEIPANPSLVDQRFRLNLLKIIAEIYCYDIKNYEKAEEVFEEVLNGIEAFGTQDPEIEAIRRAVHHGLAHIDQQNGDYEAAIQHLEAELVENPTGQELIDSTRALLSIAEIYIYHLDDEEAAQENLALAQSYINLAPVTPETNFLQARTYFNLGELYRVLLKDHALAVQNYENAISYLTGMDNNGSQELLSRVYISQGYLEIENGNYGQASDLLEQAETLIPGTADNAYQALRQAQLTHNLTVELGASYYQSTYMGQESNSGWPLHLGLNWNIGNDLRFGLSYTYGPGHSLSFNDNSSFGELPRMESGGHHLKLDMGYYHAWGDFGLSLNPFAAFDIYDYTIHGYQYNSDFSSTVGSTQTDAMYSALTQGLNLGLAYHLLDNQLTLGLGAGLSVTERIGTTPNQAAELATAEEFPGVEEPNLENDPFVSWYLHPKLTWEHFTLGFRFGQDPYNVTEQGFWSLEDKDPWRYAATLGYSNVFTFGSGNKWFLNLNLGTEIGNYFSLFGSEGIGYVVSDNFIPELALTQFYFNDWSQDNSSFNLGAALRFHFDITPDD